jgi:hypothetical protein
LAVRSIGENSSRIAVLWGGLYLDESELPSRLRELVGRLLNPVVLVHDFDQETRLAKVRMNKATTILELVLPSPEADSSAAGGRRFSFA